MIHKSTCLKEEKELFGIIVIMLCVTSVVKNGDKVQQVKNINVLDIHKLPLYKNNLTKQNVVMELNVVQDVNVIVIIVAVMRILIAIVISNVNVVGIVMRIVAVSCCSTLEMV